MCSVVIIGCKLLDIRLKGTVVNPPVEVNDLGPVLVHYLTAPQEPIFEELFCGLASREIMKPGSGTLAGEICTGFLNIAVKLHHAP